MISLWVMKRTKAAATTKDYDPNAKVLGDLNKLDDTVAKYFY